MLGGKILKVGFQFLIAVCLSFGPVSSFAQLVVSTVAGGFEGNGDAATSAALAAPHAVVIDNKDRLYIGENDNCQIRRVNKDGVIRRFAGQNICGFSGDGGQARAATFSEILAMAFDRHKNLVVSDSDNFRIRRIDSNEIVTTIAGTGSFGNTGDGGPANQANIGFVQGLTTDSQNHIYFSDTNNVVRMVDAAGIIHTVAGNSTQGFSGDGGPATAAQLSSPQGMAIDVNGNLYIADSSNNRIRKVDPGGVITTFAGNGASDNSGSGGPATSAGLSSPVGLAVRGNTLYISTFVNLIWTVDLSTQVININAGILPPTGGFNGDGNTALATRLSQPEGMAFDSAGNLFFADQGNGRVREINSSQMVTTVAGGFVGDGSPAKEASFNGIFDVHPAFDTTGNSYVADTGNNRVRKVSPDGVISTFAGNGLSGYSGDGGLATSAMLSNPNSVVVDNQGNVFIADTGNGVIRKVDPQGIISTFAQPSPFGFLSTVLIGLATDANGNLYSTDGFSVVYKTDSSGNSTIFAGMQFQLGFTATDGIPATQALLDFPTGLAVDRNGNVYIAEWLGQRVRKVDINGIISTVAGTSVQGFSGDGGPATSAMLSLPYDVAVDRQGNLYIADFVNARIRVIDAAGIIHTVAGTGAVGFNGNNLAATSTNISPAGLAVKPNGTVFFIDEDRFLVRKLH
jgi:sugar lactone lactonase YvrE